MGLLANVYRAKARASCEGAVRSVRAMTRALLALAALALFCAGCGALSPDAPAPVPADVGDAADAAPDDAEAGRCLDARNLYVPCEAGKE